MKEQIRLHEVSTTMERGEGLRGCSLSIYDSEIVFLSGSRWSGRLALWKLLAGQRELTGGRLYCGEERLYQTSFRDMGILCADRNAAFCNGLTLEENLMSLCEAGREVRSARYSGIFPGSLGNNQKELFMLFEEMGIHKSPHLLTSQAPVRDRVILWFVLAVLRKDRLICLDCTGGSFSEKDYSCLMKAARSCKRRGISVLIMDEKESALVEGADRLMIMEDGKIRKVLYSPEDYRKAIQTRIPVAKTGEEHRNLQGRSCLIFQDDTGEEMFRLREKQILGVFDASWPMNRNLMEHLQASMTEAHWKIPEEWDRKDWWNRKGIFIPEDSADCLFVSQSIGANLIMTASRRVGVHLGFVSRKMEEFLEREFCRRFGLPPVEKVEDLSARERKLLSVYRCALLRPEVLFLENPLMHFDGENRDVMLDYLRELADSGIGLIISSKNRRDLEEICQQILQLPELWLN